MIKLTKHIVVLIVMLSTLLMAQNYSVKGVVTDAQSNEGLFGANVFISSLNIGAVTNADGKFTIENVPSGTYEITVSYVGYISAKQNINVTSNTTANFKLKSQPVLLGETIVKGTRATLRETPVAFSEVKGAELEFKLASRDVPTMLQSVPSVYASAAGGGAGDARINIRGFNQRNIAIMINGVPVNDMENGWVYWSNWAGLGDVVSDIQVQRGLGASPYSVSSIGGVINIVTIGAGNRQEFSRLRTEFGSDNLKKTTVAFSTNITKKIGLTALVSRKTWDGYADQTPLNEFTYFFSIGGVFGNQSLELTGVASPQEHGQRLYQQSINTWYNRGFDYNPNWGYLNDKPFNERWNKYHKPQFNLNHNWQINKNTVLSSVLYLSIGNGYGSGFAGSGMIYGRNADGLYNLDAVWAKNSSNVDSTYSNKLNRSVSILRQSVNKHFWYGLLSTLKNQLTDKLTLNVGIDGRYYKGEHFRTVADLIGGDYFVDTRRNGTQYDINRAPKTILHVGDKMAYHNDGLVRQFGGFGQLEYKTGAVSTFLNVSASNTGYQRIDYFNFKNNDPRQATDWQNFLGYTAKTGINFNLDAKNNIFFNAGYFSKAPIFRNVFDYSNNLYKNAENEKILGIEGGYGYTSEQFLLRVNGYYTSWKNRAISKSVTDQNTDQTYYYNITGAEQRHVGIEFESQYKPNRNLELYGSFAYGSDKFASDVSAVLYPESDPNQQTKINSYVDGIYVGDFPMTTATLDFNYRFDLTRGTSLRFNPVYHFFGRHYANFNPDGRTSAKDAGINSWRLPDYYLIDVHVSYDVLFTNTFFKKLSVGLHLFNALNNFNYITDATDASVGAKDHTAQSANVFFGRARWWNMSVAFEF